MNFFSFFLSWLHLKRWKFDIARNATIFAQKKTAFFRIPLKEICFFLFFLWKSKAKGPFLWLLKRKALSFWFKKVLEDLLFFFELKKTHFFFFWLCGHFCSILGPALKGISFLPCSHPTFIFLPWFLPELLAKESNFFFEA